MPRRIMISVDVEAFAMRSTADPLGRLIWGQFSDTPKDFGIRRMMQVAEDHDARLTMFVDWPEYHTYGEPFLEVGREITRRGHAAEVHLHLDHYSDAFLAESGLARTADLNKLDDNASDLYLAEALRIYHLATGQTPTAYRAGGYRCGPAMLRALKRAGISFSSNYNRAAKHQSYSLGPRAQYQWEDGPVELPVSTLWSYLARDYWSHFNFNIDPFVTPKIPIAVSNFRSYLEQFYSEFGDDAIAVMVLHSWSFLVMDSTGQFSTRNMRAPGLFAAMLEVLKDDGIEVVTPSDLAQLQIAGGLPLIGVPVSTEAASVTPTSPPKIPLQPGIVCDVCGTPAEEFKALNGQHRICPACNSSERQRVFAKVYRDEIKPTFDLALKKVLHVAPGSAESRLFRDEEVKRVETIDIRPEVRATYHCDVCAMPEIPTGTYDAVIASYVLTCVHDLDACLAEFHRVLKPGGKLMTCDPVRFGRATIEYTDLDKITAFYGREAYDRYKIGSFRSLGDEDLTAKLGEMFKVETHGGFDAATRTRWVWYVSEKKRKAPPMPAITSYSDLAAAPFDRWISVTDGEKIFNAIKRKDVVDVPFEDENAPFQRDEDWHLEGYDRRYHEEPIGWVPD